MNWRLKTIAQPLFLISCTLFGLHKLAESMGYFNPFVDSYLDDLVVIPIFLATALFLMRLLLGASHRLASSQIWATVVIVSVFFEVIAPEWYPDVFTADWLDVLCYLLGGILFQQFGNNAISGSTDSQEETPASP
jgi:hypothetical protein